MHHINEQAAEAAARVDKLLHDLLAVPGSVEGKIVEAMRYSILGGGKQFRAFLCCASANLFDVDPHHAARTAAAIECVHTYSLIHDDLPCMDDDDMRRGKPSLHRAYDEAIAVLAGDALLTLAFEILVDEQTHPRKAVRLDLMAGLAKAAGAQGMVGGQVFDMLSPELELDAGGLTHLQQMKTGALIGFQWRRGLFWVVQPRSSARLWCPTPMISGWPFRLPMICWTSAKPARNWAKPPEKTPPVERSHLFPCLGRSAPTPKAEVLVEQAIAHLSGFGDAAQPLREAAKFVILRDN